MIDDDELDLGLPRLQLQAELLEPVPDGAEVKFTKLLCCTESVPGKSSGKTPWNRPLRVSPLKLTESVVYPLKV